jgi:uncharacterized protein (DUF983 family)
MSNRTLQIVGIIFVILLIVSALIGLPLWVPFLIVAIVLILLLFRKPS